MANADAMKKAVDDLGPNAFSCVQTRYFQLNVLSMGTSLFLPVSFDKECTSLLLTTIHSSLIDFRFRPRVPGFFLS